MSESIQWTDEKFFSDKDMKIIDKLTEAKQFPEWTLIMFDKTSTYAVVSNLTNAESLSALEDVLKAMLTELATPYSGHCDA